MSELSRLSVRQLYGVGAVRAQAYARVGVETVEDLLFYFPRAYENRGDVSLLAATRDDIKSAVILTVATEPRSVRVRRGMDVLRFRAFDESGSCTITFFNQNFLKDKFPIGSVFRFWGRVERDGRGFAMSSPAYEPFIEDKPLPALYPVYPLTDGLSQKQLQKDIASAMTLIPRLYDPLPDGIRHDNSLCTLGFALRNIHVPDDYQSLAIAKRRLIFDELFMFSLGLATVHRSQRKPGAPRCEGDLSPLFERLPYHLTAAQLRVIEDISRDMASDIPMRRIVVGDVGCGKTICAAAAMYTAVMSGRQAVLMAPTEILARQHYNDLAPLFSGLGIACGLLIGATPAAEKRRIKAALASGDAASRLNMVIGTHALISGGVEFAAPGLIVTDEQHRFGVTQRATLAEKNKNAHVLVMSATPIPRSLALVIYGDLDISRVDEMPPGRQRVDTFVVDESYRSRLDAFITRLCGEGGQVYIVCPAIEERECDDNEISLADISLFREPDNSQPPLKAVETYAAELSERLPGLRVGLIHGRLSADDKESVMRSFAEGECDVLVSTTVIEVGVNVPNACLMIVENAERFGLSQLHQLRGRVGRGRRKSYCVLVSDAKGEKARRRLETMHTVYDGYAIAETDLAMRGPGDFVGSIGQEGGLRQSGGVRFRLAGMCDDTELMTAATDAARELVESDPGLEQHTELRVAAEAMFRIENADIS
ncbi:MAG: ATP-dependent DNA helicase RecG [Eubacteriales bacterium]|nr:ATP-dependent DNA helicase RecG [Eubacteriales bacterium]